MDTEMRLLDALDKCILVASFIWYHLYTVNAVQPLCFLLKKCIAVVTHYSLFFFTLFTILILFSQLQSEISRLKNEVNQLQGQVHAIAVFLSSILVYLFILVNIIFPFQFLIFMFHTFSVVKKGWGSSGRKSNNWRNVQKRSCRNRSY